MAEILDKGTKVKFVRPSYDGVITDLKLDSGRVIYLMAYTDEEGTEHEGWFTLEQLTVVPAGE